MSFLLWRFWKKSRNLPDLPPELSPPPDQEDSNLLGGGTPRPLGISTSGSNSHRTNTAAAATGEAPENADDQARGPSVLRQGLACCRAQGHDDDATCNAVTGRH